VIDAPFALAFTAGLVATVNPCGFAMLPAYLSYFMGLADDDVAAGGPAAVRRGLVIGAVVSSGCLRRRVDPADEPAERRAPVGRAERLPRSHLITAAPRAAR
jgi:hypothetical protein